MRHFYSLALAFIVCLGSSGAIANELDLAALTCAGDQSVEGRMKELERLGHPAGDGTYVLDGRFTFGAVCVERVSVMGAFGALIVIASICDAKPEALLAFVRSKYPELEPVKDAAAADAGVIAGYQSTKRAFVLSRGRFSMTQPPDPKSTEVSYMCSYQSSGAQ